MKKRKNNKMSIGLPISGVAIFCIARGLFLTWRRHGFNLPDVSPVLAALLIVFVIIAIVLFITKDKPAFETIIIGNQEWMTEDLEGEKNKHPYLYDDIDLPEGWRVPSKQDFIDLKNYLLSQYNSEQEAIVFLEKNWYKGNLEDDTCNLYWTNELNQDDSLLCMCLQKKEITFRPVNDDAVAHLRLVRNI